MPSLRRDTGPARYSSLRENLTITLSLVMMGIGAIGVAIWIGPSNIFDPAIAVPGSVVNIILYLYMASLGLTGWWLFKVTGRLFSMSCLIRDLVAGDEEPQNGGEE